MWLSPPPQTFLSPHVTKLLNLATTVSAQTFPNSELEASPKYLDDNFLLNFDAIFARLPPASADKSADWYETAVAALAPVFAQAAAVTADRCAVLAAWEAEGWLSWARCPRRQLEQLLAQLSDPVGVLETVLEICPVLERGLGNILAGGGEEPVPALLRDILAAGHLDQVLGTPAVTFLQVPYLRTRYPCRQVWYRYLGTGYSTIMG